MRRLFASAVVLVLMSGALLAAAPSSSAAGGDELLAGQSLAPGRSIVSANGQYAFTMQGDGNAVVYRGATALWSARTTGSGANRVVMQPDGNLVVYDASDAAKWHSRTMGNPGSRLVMQDDGNLVLYLADGRATWSWRSGLTGNGLDRLGSNASLADDRQLQSSDGRYRFVMQRDGNAVVYDGSRALWHTRTVGTGRYLVMQGDGNLVVYDAAGAARWHSRTSSNSGATLTMQRDGNLVIHSSSGRALWSWRGGRVTNPPTTTGHRWPLGSCPGGFRYSSYRNHSRYDAHGAGLAIDVNRPNDLGQAVYASDRGEIQSVNRSNGEVTIRHANGTRTRYAHMRAIPGSFGEGTTGRGRPVTRGQKIGEIAGVGAGGNANAHLHYEQMSSAGAARSIAFEGRTISYPWVRGSGNYYSFDRPVPSSFC